MKRTSNKNKTNNSPSPRAQTIKDIHSFDNEEVEYDASASYRLYFLPDLDDTIFAHIGDYLEQRDDQLILTLPDVYSTDGKPAFWVVKQFNHVLMIDEYKLTMRFPEELMLSIINKPVTRLCVSRTSEEAVNVNGHELCPLTEAEIPNDLIPWGMIVPEVKP